jgi:drug/metabolite transporter (DMT)-like permease
MPTKVLDPVIRKLDWAIIVGLGISFGSTLILNAILVREIGPLGISTLRVGLGALAVWALVLLNGRAAWLSPRKLLHCLVFGVFMFAIPFAVYPVSLGYVTTGVVGIVNAMSPVAIVLVSHVWAGGERASWAKFTGVALGVLGIVVLSLPRLMSEGSSEILGILFTLLAPLSFAIAMNYMRKLSGTDVTLMVAVSMTAATVFLVPIMLLVEGAPVVTTMQSYGALLLLGPILTGLFFTIALWMSRRVGPTNASLLTFISPISTLILGWAFLSESVDGFQLAGMIIIFAGLLVIDGGLLRRLRARPT